MKVGLDPGHGGKDRANRGPTGYIEADGALDIAIACMNELVNHGIEVVMTRKKDATLSLTQRAKILNDAKVDIALSIHSNACGNPKVRGVETIHSIHTGGLGDELATIIYKRLQNDLGLPGRRVFSRESENYPGHDYYTIIQKTRMPTVIVEVEFHTNPDAEKLLKDPEFRKRAGECLANAILEFKERWMS